MLSPADAVVAEARAVIGDLTIVFCGDCIRPQRLECVVMPDVNWLYERIGEFRPEPRWIPPGAVSHFALALGSVDNLPYLDATYEQEGQLPARIEFGKLEAITDGGNFVELEYRGDHVGPAKIRPLRGRVLGIEVSYDADAERGRILPGAVIITTALSAQPIELPLTPKRDGADFLAPIIAALTAT
jgi:hypothetical protein